MTLSIDPARVMAGRVPNEGDLCVASVTSQEDHGYIMDVGCTTTRGFLPQGAAKKLVFSYIDSLILAREM